MSPKLLNLFLHFSGLIFRLKQKIVLASSWPRALPYAVLLMATECGFVIVSFPLYLLVSPKKLQERGLIFPSKDKEKNQWHTYIVRRRISLTTAIGAGGVFLLKFVFISVVSSYLLGAQTLLAASQDWTFNTPTDYTYDSAKIEVTNGVAQLKDQGTGGSCGGSASVCTDFSTSPTCAAQGGCSWGGSGAGTTSNPSFDVNSTGWTYADWENPSKVAGTRVSSGGNPNGYINITTQAANNTSISGYWRQPFTTTVDNPTATVNFDWKITGYSGSGTSAFNVYAFVESTAGAPTIGNQIWSQTITGTTNWASVTNLDVSSKLGAAGTYYLKLVARRVTGSGAGGNDIIGFDNVQLNWSKSSSCSGTPTACTTFSNSSTCGAQSGCSWATVPVYPATSPAVYPAMSLAPTGVTSWNSFVETATKNGGAINYQLSSDDGATWKYWNGSTWATASTDANSNSASVINSNIGSYSVSAGKIIWKAFLTSNGSEQISLDNVAIGYTQNAPPSIQNLTVSQDTSSYVKVNYTLQDNNSDPASLVNYEYSLTGLFAGEQLPMTPVESDPAHSGITQLSSSSSGVNHTFVWDAALDLGSVYSNTVYVRLRANDGIANSEFAANSSAIAVDYVEPVVSNITAAQVTTSRNVKIDYNLSDDTTNNILVELQISSDNGSTWTIPVTSATGDVGATVTSGNNKSIIWQSNIDFANQEQNNMMVRVRAKDKYQNQSDYIDSIAFALDNKNPETAIATDLLAQPLAGATDILIGGSFSESNPNTNNFYFTLNAGSYGSAVVGDTNTATPSDKSVPVGVTLKGNDYISAVKIVHTDDFGWSTTNENLSPNATYKYVKPYTPVAPSIGSPTENTLGVTINKNSNEVDGLEYAIFETTQNSYVQSDGSLSGSPYWQSAGTITVTGLNQPISQYSFKVKSRNSSDASHTTASESEFSSAASSDYKSPNLSITSASQTTDGTKYVVINYVGTDYQNQANNLVTHEYSLNNTDWQTMTEKAGVNSDGVSGLSFNGSGKSLVFAWDVATDLPNTEDSTVYIRLKSNDSITDSNMATSAAFTVNTAGPVISNISAAQTAGTNSVIITYDLVDSAGANNLVVLDISSDNGSSFTVPTTHTSGNIGAGVPAGLERTITWNVGTDLPDQEISTMKIKLKATDKYGNQGTPVESNNFSIDTKTPVINDVTAAQAAGSALVTVNYGLTDASASNVEFAVSANSGSTWTVTANTFTGNIGENQTAGSKTFTWNAAADFSDQESDTMRIRVRATDNFGHQSAYQESTDFSINTKILAISNITAEQTSGTNNVIIRYNLNKAANISFDLSADGGTTWNIEKNTVLGAVGNVTAGNKTISWNAGVDFNNEEKSTMRVRLSGVDNTGATSPYYESADFSVDTAAPLGLFSLIKFASTNSSVTMNWSSGVADAHFVHYELWHGANQSDVIGRTGTAKKWSVTNDTDLNTINTISTVITGLNLTSDYYVKIWAVDDYGNESTIDGINVYSAPIQKTLTLNAGTGGTTSPTPGEHVYTVGTTLTITGIPNTGYNFARWEEGGVALSTASTLDITLDNDKTLSAVFEAIPVNYDLTIQSSTGSGSVSPEVGSHTYTNGTEVTITATPVDGWVFDHWVLGDTDGGSINPLSITVNANNTLKAIFVKTTPPPPTQKVLTINATIGGSTNPDTGLHNYDINSTATITATPNSGYNFVRWEKDGVLLSTNSSVNIVMDDAHTLSAIFEPKPEAPIETPIVTPPATTSGTNYGGGSLQVIDKTVPTKPILSPLTNPTSVTRVQISGLAEPGSKIDLYDNNNLVGRLSSTVDNDGRFSQIFNLVKGSHVLTIKATDSANNTSEASDPISLDIITAAPTTPLILSPKNNDSVTESTPDLIGIADPFAQVEITFGGNKFITVANADGAWRFGIPSGFALKDGEYNFTIKATDTAGNVSLTAGLVINKITAAPGEPVGVISNTSSAGAPVSSDIIRNNTEAVELAGAPVPAVAGVTTKATDNLISFSGTALPNQDVIVYVHSDQALIYRVKANSQGQWQVNHSQNDVELASGEHTVYAVAIDPAAKIKSKPSPVSTFTINKNLLVTLFNSLNPKTTAVTLTAILLAMFWLYWVKKRGLVNA